MSAVVTARVQEIRATKGEFVPKDSKDGKTRNFYNLEIDWNKKGGETYTQKLKITSEQYEILTGLTVAIEQNLFDNEK